MHDADIGINIVMRNSGRQIWFSNEKPLLQTELEHYVVCDDPNRPIIITAEAKGRKRRNSKKKEYVFRAIIRTVAVSIMQPICLDWIHVLIILSLKGEERYILSCPVDTKKARIQALKQVNAQLQVLHPYSLRISSDDYRNINLITIHCLKIAGR